MSFHGKSTLKKKDINPELTDGFNESHKIKLKWWEQFISLYRKAHTLIVRTSPPALTIP